MAKWTSSTGNTVEILPWMEKGFKFISLDCNECVGGSVAHGRVEMVYLPDDRDENSEMITKESEVTIKLGTTELGVILTIHGIITSRNYLKNLFSFDFSCFPRPEFWTRRGKVVTNNIKDAIESIWGNPDTIDYRGTETDLPDGISFNQSSEYDYRYLQYLCESYKKDTIFAFGLEGLLIKDLIGIDSSGNKEPHWTLPGNVHAIQDQGMGNDKYVLTYDPELYMTPTDPWENEGIKSKYWDVITFNDQYRMTKNSNTILRENRFWNKRIYRSRMYNQINLKHTNFLQVYRLGDVVKYFRAGEKDKMPWGVYLISSITYHYRSEPSPGTSANPNEFPFSIDYKLHCIEEGGKIMQDEDPVQG